MAELIHNTFHCTSTYVSCVWLKITLLVCPLRMMEGYHTAWSWQRKYCWWLLSTRLGDLWIPRYMVIKYGCCIRSILMLRGRVGRGGNMWHCDLWIDPAGHLVRFITDPPTPLSSCWCTSEHGSIDRWLGINMINMSCIKCPVNKIVLGFIKCYVWNRCLGLKIVSVIGDMDYYM